MVYESNLIYKKPINYKNENWLVKIFSHEILNASSINIEEQFKELYIYITENYLKDIKSFNIIIKRLIDSFIAGKWGFTDEEYFPIFYLTNINFKEVNEEQWFNLFIMATLKEKEDHASGMQGNLFKLIPIQKQGTTNPAWRKLIWIHVRKLS